MSQLSEPYSDFPKQAGGFLFRVASTYLLSCIYHIDASLKTASSHSPGAFLIWIPLVSIIASST